ncbi:MAG: hypothetical protein ABR880_24765, partial [Candidatus Sulfotelmatobacter sp.]
MFLDPWIVITERPVPSPTSNIAHPTIAGLAILGSALALGIGAYLFDRWWLSRQIISEASSAWREYCHRRLHSVFHWKPEALISGFITVGIGWSIAQQYGLACAFLLFSGVWGIGCWITSDRLRNKRRNLVRLLRRRNYSGDPIKDSRKYYAEEFGISAVIIFLTIIAIGWVVVYKMQVQFENVEAHFIGQAAVTPNDNAYRSLFSLTNGSASDVVRESQRTYQTSVMVGHLERIALPTSRFEMTSGPVLLRKNGGAETNLFVPQISTQPLACADLTVEVVYSLPSWTFWGWKIT